MSVVYATLEYVSTLATSTPISAHVPVDYELHGCPINKHQPGGVERVPERAAARDPSYSVCTECKRRGERLRHGRARYALPGPVTHAGCGAICPSYYRGCYYKLGRWRA